MALWTWVLEQLLLSVVLLCSDFSQATDVANIGIITNFVCPHICSYILYLQHMMLVNVKLDISGCNRIAFEGCRLHWSS